MKKTKKTSAYYPEKLLLTAGPSISKREIEYVTDAVKTGWNENFRDYLTRFEESFASYTNTKYAWGTSSGTGALHIALLACDIKKGDEVIVPEITFVATSNAVEFVGAKPVFVDVEPDTWCMDPVSFEKAITPKTKAVIPVHLYGHPANMTEINRIAKKHGLYVIEDACPAAGAEVRGKRVGGLSDIAAFSFQGAKTLVTGEGGMITTNNKKLFDKAVYWGNHAKDHSKIFWHTNVGYMYRMANILGALGLAQLERNDSFVESKKKIFSWYEEILGSVKGIHLNVEKPWAKNIYWMSSVVLDTDIPIKRDKLMSVLKKRNIDTRPFFYPISMFPMYKPQPKTNPNAYWVGTHGINLPSGVCLKKQQVEYIANQVKDIVQKG